MHRKLVAAGCALVFVTGLLVGCGRQSPPQPLFRPTAKEAGGPQPAPGQPASAAGLPAAAMPPIDITAALEPTPAERYDAAMLEAVGLLAQKKYVQAAAALESARAIQDDELVRRELERVRLLMAQQAASERMLADIQAILNEGRPEEAGRLAAAALLQVNSTEDAAALSRLKRQADALLAAQNADARAQKQRLQLEATQAMNEQNLRAAAVALEQALQLEDDVRLRQQLAELQVRLSNYDQNRQSASELRQDPYRLEEAIAALEAAAKAWDTLQVRQELDECRLALRKRRDRIGVVEFEVRGDVGLPLAGRVVADELLPVFKSRFDVVERGQINRVLAELKLQTAEIASHDSARQELARLTRTQYLVLGSLTPLDGITVHARLVDLRTGLIVQTAKVVAPHPEGLMAMLPRLGGLLLMSDEQRLAYEQQRLQQAAPPSRVVVQDPLPPPPAPPGRGAPVAMPVRFDLAPPPAVGNLRFEDLERLPAPRLGEPAPSGPTVSVEAETRIKNGLLHVAVELGDSYFRAGRFQDAFTQFEVALSLNPSASGIRIRLDQCRPHLPPPPVVVTPPPPPPPRIAVLDFQVYGDPAVPPALGYWAGEQLAPYLFPPYAPIERGELWWYMGRLGMTYQDLLTDPSARRWLGRALNVRYFLSGAIRAGQGLEVTTYLLDAEEGVLLGRGRVLAFDKRDLKLKLPELARQTLLPPRERDRFLEDQRQYDLLVAEGRRCFERNDFTLAIDFFTRAGKLRPCSVQVTVLIQDCEARRRQAEIEAAAQREWERQRAAAEAWAQRQWQLALQAEQARQLALREAAERAEAARQQQLLQRDRACDQLLLQARAALQTKNFALSIELFESAAALRGNDAVLLELAGARSQFEDARLREASQARNAREAELQRQREAEFARAQAQLENERKQREAAERARREAEEARELAQYLKLREEGRRQLEKNNPAQALAAFQSAKRIRKTDEIVSLIESASQAQEAALAREAATRAALQKELDDERQAREAAEAEARKNQEQYAQNMNAASEALAAQRYDVAVARYQDAVRIFATEEARQGLRQAEESRRAVQAEAERQARQAERVAEFRKLLNAGQSALAAKEYEQAVQHFTAAKSLDPTHKEVIAGLTRAEALRDAQLSEARRSREQQERAAEFKRLMDAGKANVAARQYDAAVAAFTEAQKLDPANKEVKSALADALKARSVVEKDAADAARRTQQYQKLVQEGKLAMTSKQYDLAIKAFTEAQKLQPSDAVVARLIDEARQQKTAEAEAVRAEARRREEDSRRAAEVKKSLAEAKLALANRDLNKADKLLSLARESAPGDAELRKLEVELQTQKEKAALQARSREAADQRDKQVGQLVKTAREAIKARKFDEARGALDEAARLAPGDQEVARAQRDLAQARVEAESSRQPRDDRASTPSKTAPHQPRELAQQAESGLRFADAVRFYKEVLKLKPDDEEAARRLKFCQRMADGQKALAARKYKDAAREFEDALKVIPDHPDARKLLKQAKDGK